MTPTDRAAMAVGRRIAKAQSRRELAVMLIAGMVAVLLFWWLA